MERGEGAHIPVTTKIDPQWDNNGHDLSKTENYFGDI